MINLGGFITRPDAFLLFFDTMSVDTYSTLFDYETVPDSMNGESSRISVVVFTQNGDSQRGVLSYNEKGPSITIDDVELRNAQGVSFRIMHDSHPSKLPLTEEDIVVFQPLLTKCLGYSRDRKVFDTMYPPSSDEWVSFLIEGNSSLYIVQKIRNKTRLLLTVIDIHEGTLLDAVLLNPYEIGILQLNRDWKVYTEILQSDMAPDMSKISNLLDAPSASWSSISKIVEGVTIPNLALGKTMRETMDKLVPRSFPVSTRNQIMAFLAWEGEASIPEEDPADFLKQYVSTRVFQSLVTGHLQCILDDIDPPPYVRIMMMADKGLLKFADRPHLEDTLTNPWHYAWLRLSELFPDWTGRVVKFAIELQKLNEVVPGLPVTKENAMASKKSWSDRFAMVSHGLIMRGHVQKELLGLKTVTYIGAAYRWPHKHLELSARLGFQEHGQPHLQVMTLPTSAIPRVTRMIKSARVIDWEQNIFNLSLYDADRRKWTLNSSVIEKSLERQRTLKQLRNEFGYVKGDRSVEITKEQTRLLDLISWGIYLRPFESGLYSIYYGLDSKYIQNGLTEMKNLGIFDLQYFLVMQKTVSICVIAEGPLNRICSLSRAFLKHSPSAHIRISNNGASCSIVARVPEDKSYRLLTNLPNIASENDISMKCLPISAYTGYRNDLLQRLLNDDGIWDDDVSGLLSQIRLQPKDET